MLRRLASRWFVVALAGLVLSAGAGAQDRPARGSVRPEAAVPERGEAGAGVPPGAAAPVEAPPPPGGSVMNALSGKELYHGNFCGYGSRVGVLDPVDELDAACKRHDECYIASRRRSCACDRQLKQEAIAIANGAQFSREIRTRAGVIAQAAELMSCVAP